MNCEGCTYKQSKTVDAALVCTDCKRAYREGTKEYELFKDLYVSGCEVEVINSSKEGSDEVEWYFEDNKDKYTVDMLDEEIEEDAGISLRDYLELGISLGYIEPVDDFTKLSTREISRMVDIIDYLETK